MTRPNAPAVNRKLSCSSSVKLSFSMAVEITAGKHPALPAVGVAQTSPILAFNSLTAIAFLTAARIVVSEIVFPDCKY